MVSILMLYKLTVVCKWLLCSLYQSVNGLLCSSIIAVIFVHLINDNGIWNYPENYPWLRQIHYMNYSPLNKDSITGWFMSLRCMVWLFFIDYLILT